MTGGMIVGWYCVPGPACYGFALSNGKYTSFSYPGAQTFAGGINAADQVVGSYTLDFLTYHGFISSPIPQADFQLSQYPSRGNDKPHPHPSPHLSDEPYCGIQA